MITKRELKKIHAFRDKLNNLVNEYQCSEANIRRRVEAYNRRQSQENLDNLKSAETENAALINKMDCVVRQFDKYCEQIYESHSAEEWVGKCFFYEEDCEYELIARKCNDPGCYDIIKVRAGLDVNCVLKVEDNVYLPALIRFDEPSTYKEFCQAYKMANKLLINRFNLVMP